MNSREIPSAFHQLKHLATASAGHNSRSRSSRPVPGNRAARRARQQARLARAPSTFTSTFTFTASQAGASRTGVAMRGPRTLLVVLDVEEDRRAADDHDEQHEERDEQLLDRAGKGAREETGALVVAVNVNANAGLGAWGRAHRAGALEGGRASRASPAQLQQTDGAKSFDDLLRLRPCQLERVAVRDQPHYKREHGEDVEPDERVAHTPLERHVARDALQVARAAGVGTGSAGRGSGSTCGRTRKATVGPGQARTRSGVGRTARIAQPSPELAGPVR